ncbi:hypothetical protein TH25_01230 [Thalassospira profundimaris]|uniref:Uncharacterized protein n=1 Tax=Thalassospira profundimaris TaxID=502049 RepID=A0A367XLH2_9PROT|nr:hypothetical protein [Thalassospira profundimaris]RCK54010.1 hypothetical protein TH25_01230 [Thalassospira profundimaris]
MRYTEVSGSKFAILYKSDDGPSEIEVGTLLSEGRKTQDLGKGWKLAWDGPHYDQGEPHVHVYRNGKELYSVNISGLGHDGSSGKEIHRVPLRGIQAKWSHVKKLIESEEADQLAENYVPLEIKEALAAVVLEW